MLDSSFDLPLFVALSIHRTVLSILSCTDLFRECISMMIRPMSTHLYHHLFPLQDNMTVFSGGCDNAVKMWNVSQGATAATTVGQHAAPVK